ncbi:hypothetical protein [Bradyrhizobium sp. F1.13.3]|uniref:hypothetical protein n=1 Tax=Bradyrhizobium sp. F1.13.3 TaxID=3156351 RepID=UPI003394A953
MLDALLMATLIIPSIIELRIDCLTTAGFARLQARPLELEEIARQKTLTILLNIQPSPAFHKPVSQWRRKSGAIAESW